MSHMDRLVRLKVHTVHGAELEGACTVVPRGEAPALHRANAGRKARACDRRESTSEEKAKCCEGTNHELAAGPGSGKSARK